MFIAKDIGTKIAYQCYLRLKLLKRHLLLFLINKAYTHILLSEVLKKCINLLYFEYDGFFLVKQDVLNIRFA